MRSTATLEKTVEILLVEDNEADIRLTREVLADGRMLNRLSVTKDGEEAMSFLRRERPYQDAPRPDLILLDLNLPRKDGREVLAEIKNDPALRRIPVVILTTSRAEADIIQTYELHANCYIVKPVDLGQFINVIRSIEDFWLKMVRLPNGA
ncbi:MAG TPA: response regulator [Phycisphaerales bacterium]|nr:response regulator [Phycisphaerales bacterium]